MKEAGAFAWRGEQGWRGGDLDQVALEVPWDLRRLLATRLVVFAVTARLLSG